MSNTQYLMRTGFRTVRYSCYGRERQLFAAPKRIYGWSARVSLRPRERVPRGTEFSTAKAPLRWAAQWSGSSAAGLGTYRGHLRLSSSSKMCSKGSYGMTTLSPSFIARV